MAVYNTWSETLTLDQLREELADIYSDVPEITVSEVESNIFTASFDEDNKWAAQISTTAQMDGLVINGTFVKCQVSSAPTGFRYYARSDKELIIASTGSGTASVQFGIGRTSDGHWGAVALGLPTTSAIADTIMSTGHGKLNDDQHSITGRSNTSTQYLALRQCVKNGSITFDNIFVNTYGLPAAWSCFELNNECYASGYGNTGNNDHLILKL